MAMRSKSLLCTTATARTVIEGKPVWATKKRPTICYSGVSFGRYWRIKAAIERPAVDSQGGDASYLLRKNRDYLVS